MLSFIGRLANPFASVTREEIREATRREPFSRWLPYLAYDPERGLYINRDGTAGFMFESPPLPAADENTHRSLTGMLDLLPPRGVLSVTLISFPYLDPVVERYARLKKRAAENPVLAGAIKRYAEHLKRWTRGIPHLLGTPLRDFRLIFALKIPVSGEKDLENLTELKTAFRETLRGAHLVPREFGPEALIHTLFLLFNGRPEPNIYWDPGRPLYDHLILSETPVEVRKGKLRIGPSTFRALTFKQVAPDVNLLKLGELFGGSRGPIDDTNQIPSHFFYTVFFVHDPGVGNILRSKAFLFKKQVEKEDSIITRFIGEYAREHIQAVNELEKGAKYLYAVPIFWIWDADDTACETAAKRAARLMTSRGFVPQEESEWLAPLVPLFIASLPFGFYNEGNNIQNLDRHFLARTDQVVSLLPVAVDYCGGGEPHLILISRKGQLVPFDPFDPVARNKNVCVMGTTGGGKSFFLNLYVLSMYASGAVVWIFDIGYSYRKLCKLVGGRYIDLGEKNISLNPFSLVPKGEDQESQNERIHHLDAIAALYGTMAYSRSKGEPDHIEAALLRHAVQWAWNEEGREADLNLVWYYLAKFPEEAGPELKEICDETSTCREDIAARAHKLSYALAEWTSRGDYGRWFNGKATLDFFSSDAFVVLELEKIKRVPPLLKALTLTCLNAATANLYLLDRSIPKVLLFEECGVTLVETGGGAQELFAGVVEEAYRRARKFNGSTVTVFQGPMDLERIGKVGPVILGNSEFLFFLPSDQYPEAIKKGILPFKGAESLLSSVSSARPRYSELGIKTPYGLGVVRVVADGFLYWVCTSDPEEWAKVETLAREKGDLLSALTELADRRDREMEKFLRGV